MELDPVRRDPCLPVFEVEEGDAYHLGAPAEVDARRAAIVYRFR
jgi:hypothetical protein